MKSILLLLCMSLFISQSYGQVCYTGFIGNDSVEMVTQYYSDGPARAVYAFLANDEPIEVEGEYTADSLILIEKSPTDEPAFAIIFTGFKPQSDNLKGMRTDLASGESKKIALKKQFDLDEGDEAEYDHREILQPVSLDESYFRLLVSKGKDYYYPKVTGIKIIRKKTDQLIQKIDLNDDFIGLDQVATGDYNFDNYTDFSVFKSLYAGANTESSYFLFDPQTGKYFDSGFQGISLTFDEVNKQIIEVNACCAGQQEMISKYAVVNNSMVLIEAHCYIWDDKKQAMTERKLKKCQ